MKSILVVEDEKLMCELISIHLEDQFELAFVHDGAKALALVKQELFDLMTLLLRQTLLDFKRERGILTPQGGGLTEVSNRGVRSRQKRTQRR
jgi:CheY-like chemotaxis protein